MRLFATATLLALVLAAPASAQISNRVQTTGVAALRVFNNGYYGADVGIPVDTTFRFNNGSKLYEGQLIVAVSPTQVSGQPYSNSPPTGGGPGAGFDWTFGPRPAPVAAPAPFTQALQTTFTDAGATNIDPAGITVVQRTLSRTGDAFVVVEVNISSPSPRTGVYVGMFADFDIATNALDLGNFDAATRTVYAFRNATTGDLNYYGVSLLGRPHSGWSASSIIDTSPDDNQTQIYRALTTNGMAATVAADRRLLVGAGPLTLAAGVPQTVRFAYVGGTNLANLTANAAIAQGLFTVGTSEGPSAAGVELLASVPNPASAAATLGFTLDAAQDVRLAVYDVLGREVAVVVDGARSAGTHTPTLDTAGLPSGVYVVRLTAGATTVTRRFTVAR